MRVKIQEQPNACEGGGTPRSITRVLQGFTCAWVTAATKPPQAGFPGVCGITRRHVAAMHVRHAQDLLPLGACRSSATSGCACPSRHQP